MGFCLFSTVAIAAIHAANAHGLDRIAVLDFDVHHGNGTQDVLWHESRVRFVSSHQMPLYPGSGGIHQKGAFGQVINLPLKSGTGGAEMQDAWERVLTDEIEPYAPQLVLVSAGFDAHTRDPLANLHWGRPRISHGWRIASAIWRINAAMGGWYRRLRAAMIWKPLATASGPIST